MHLTQVIALVARQFVDLSLQQIKVIPGRIGAEKADSGPVVCRRGNLAENFSLSQVHRPISQLAWGSS